MRAPMELDEVGPEYRSIHDDNLRLTGFRSEYFCDRKVREMARCLASSGSDQHTGTVLDLGCGDGLCASYLQRHFPDSSIHGIDVAWPGLQVATSRHPHGALFSIYDGERAPFADSSFDLVLVANVLHHVTAAVRNRLLREIHRLLRADGRLFIFEHNPYNPVTRYLVRTCCFDHGVTLLSPLRLRRLLRNAGFTPRFGFMIFVPGMLRRLDVMERFMRWLPLGGQYVVDAHKRRSAVHTHLA